MFWRSKPAALTEASGAGGELGAAPSLAAEAALDASCSSSDNSGAGVLDASSSSGTFSSSDDSNNTTSSSSSNGGHATSATAGFEAGAAAAAAAAAAEAEAVGEDMAYVNTELTKRFAGKYRRLDFPTFEQMMAEDAMNNCGVRSVIAGAGGAVLGVAFGVFTASLDTGQGIDAAVVEETKSTKQVLKETWKLMRTKSASYAKGFAVMGLVYSGCECLIEKHRARHDVWNAPLAGCAAGGIMAAPAGPKAMCFGCASFAAFSYAIEKFLQ